MSPIRWPKVRAAIATIQAIMEAGGEYSTFRSYQTAVRRVARAAWNAAPSDEGLGSPDADREAYREINRLRSEFQVLISQGYRSAEDTGLRAVGVRGTEFSTTQLPWDKGGREIHEAITSDQGRTGALFDFIIENARAGGGHWQTIQRRIDMWAQRWKEIKSLAMVLGAALLKGKKLTWVIGRTEKHCFIAGTPVLTSTGELPIESIGPGALVLTRSGWRIVLRTHRHIHRGDLAEVTVGGRSVVCTPEHRFWTMRGWVEARDLVAQDSVRGEVFADRICTHIAFPDADDRKSKGAIGRILSAVFGASRKLAPRKRIGSRVAMPIVSVGKDQQAGRNEHVGDTDVADRDLLLERNAQIGKNGIQFAVEAGLRPALRLARGNAALAGFLARLFGVHRSPASKGGSPPPFDASLTSVLSRLFGVCRCPLLESGASATNTLPRREGRPMATDDSMYGAEAPASQLRNFLLGMSFVQREDVVNDGPGEFFHTLDYTAVAAVTLHPNDFNATVYNLAVEGQPEFVAAGMLVHNCGDCARYAGRTHYAKDWMAAGAVPQSRNLECRGYRCDCKLVPTKGPVSAGTPTPPMYGGGFSSRFGV